MVVQKKMRVFDKKQIAENEYIYAYFLKHYQVHAALENAEILKCLDWFQSWSKPISIFLNYFFVKGFFFVDSSDRFDPGLFKNDTFSSRMFITTE